MTRCEQEGEEAYLWFFEEEDPAWTETAGALGQEAGTFSPELERLRHSDVDQGEEVVGAERRKVKGVSDDR